MLPVLRLVKGDLLRSVKGIVGGLLSQLMRISAQRGALYVLEGQRLVLARSQAPGL